MKKKRIILLGDSITQGLGSKKINFTHLLGRMLGESYTVCNLALTGTTINYALELLNRGRIENDSTIVILYGNVDAQIRPNREGIVYPKLPKRYHGNGMLMPRPFYSKSFAKCAFQHFDNILRSLFSRIITIIDGTEQWVPIDEFCAKYSEVVQRLAINNRVICCSTVYIDAKLFWESDKQFELYNELIQTIAEKSKVQYLNLFDPLKELVENRGWDSAYNKDHFHPNSNGYELIAKHIAEMTDPSIQSFVEKL